MNHLSSELRPRFYSIVTATIVLIGGLLAILYCLTIHTGDESFFNDNVYEWEEVGTIAYDGIEQQINKLPFATEGKEGDILTYTTTLHKYDSNTNTIMFWGMHQKVRIFLDGRLVDSYGKYGQNLFGKSPGKAWIIVKLPLQYEGMELRIELETVYAHYGRTMGKLYIGTKTSLLYLVLLQAFLGLLVELPVLVIGVVMLLAGALFRENKLISRRILYLGLFAILASLWMFLEERLGQVYIRSVGINQVFFYIVYSLLPIVLIRFLMSYRSFANSIIMKISFYFAILNFFCIHFFQLTGLMDYPQTIHCNLILGIIVVLSSFITYIKDIMQHNSIRKDIYWATLTYAICGLIDILRYFLEDYKSNILFFSKIGLFFFIVILGYSALKQISSEHASAIEKKTYKKLAYTDMMTGLPNRTAFEERMEELRNSDEKPIIAIADINNLKFINDSYGHRYGDEAITLVAKSLKETMGEIVTVYRIGGDEFCIICSSAEKLLFEERFIHIQSNLDHKERELSYKLIVACSYVDTKEDGIDKAFIEADKKMYEEKSRLKEISRLGNEETS